MENLGHILTAALSGGLFGLIGNLGSRLFAWLDAREQFAQKKAQWTYETELLRLQRAAPAPETEHDAPDAAPFALSAREQAPSPYGWVNAVRALVRPALTVGLAAILAAAYFSMTPGDSERAYVTESLVFAAVTAIVWWFGDRAPRRDASR